MRRRELIGMLCAPWLAAELRAQFSGMASRTVKASPRGKPSGLPFHAHFTDVARSAGLRSPVIYGGVDRKAYILETVGCGAAFLDYDNDGWLDIFLPSGTRFEGSEGATNRLYKNNRDGTFTDVTEKAGLQRTGWSCGVAVADFDNDGFDDLFLSGWPQNALYRNNGDGTFTDVTEKAGLLHPKTRWGTGCTFIDYDRNGLLDLFVGTYLDFDPKTVPPAGASSCNYKGIPVHCGPRGLPPGSGYLYRNNGDGTFTDVTEASGIGKAKGSYLLTAVSADFDNDGWPDIYVACDSTPSLLFRNNHDGTFREVGLLSGAALSEDGNPQAGMGLGIGDYNLDGSLDIFKTHFWDDIPGLLRYQRNGNFDDVAVASGLGVETRFVGWGAGIVDLDNDGLPDLFMVSGSVFPEVAKKLANYPLEQPRTIFRNLGGGKFEELLDAAGEGIAAAHCSRGCAFGDFDNDGDLDVLVVNLNEPPSLLRNDVSGNNHWVKVKLVGVKSNRGAIGARVTARYGARVQAQEVLSQSSFLSASDPRLHFGLGAELKADLEIRWPNGGKETVAGVQADQLVVIREGEGVVKGAGWKRGR